MSLEDCPIELPTIPGLVAGRDDLQSPGGVFWIDCILQEVQYNWNKNKNNIRQSKYCSISPQHPPVCAATTTSCTTVHCTPLGTYTMIPHNKRRRTYASSIHELEGLKPVLGVGPFCSLPYYKDIWRPRCSGVFGRFYSTERKSLRPCLVVRLNETTELRTCHESKNDCGGFVIILLSFRLVES